MLSCEYCKNVRNMYLEEHVWTAASEPTTVRDNSKNLTVIIPVNAIDYLETLFVAQIEYLKM